MFSTTWVAWSLSAFLAIFLIASLNLVAFAVVSVSSVWMNLYDSFSSSVRIVNGWISLWLKEI